MQKSQLILSAEQLAPPPPIAGQLLSSKSDYIAQCLSQSLATHPELNSLIGEGNFDLMESYHRHHIHNLSAISELFDAKSFVENTIWDLRTHLARGFQPQYWSTMFPEAENYILSELDTQLSQYVAAMYEWLIDNLNHLVPLCSEEISFYEALSPLKDKE